MNNRDFEIIKELIQSGIDLLRNNPSGLHDSTFKIWLGHSQKIVELIARDNPNIILNYLRLSLDLQRNINITNAQRMDFCLKYLIKVLEVI